ncbi:hypothetical protein [Sphingobacterium multivorum]|uniref:hypothetical protein n=1 Tax=Sphingobacterium multivorum TaxID=28454 RepID=UPI0028B0E079|nr:hypothetical protein [Sphingobacterium multivorum]
MDVFIASYDIVEAFGVYLEDGALSILERPPKPRLPFYNEWEDENGRDYDVNDKIVYEPQIFDVPLLIKGDSMSDYRKKRADFLQLISQPFDFQVLDWGEAFQLRLIDIVGWDYINVGLTSKTSARFVLRFENNHVLPTYVFRYLADNKGRYIIINDNKRILVKTKYHA